MFSFTTAMCSVDSPLYSSPTYTSFSVHGCRSPTYFAAINCFDASNEDAPPYKIIKWVGVSPTGPRSRSVSGFDVTIDITPSTSPFFVANHSPPASCACVVCFSTFRSRALAAASSASSSAREIFPLATHHATTPRASSRTNVHASALAASRGKRRRRSSRAVARATEVRAKRKTTVRATYRARTRATISARERRDSRATGVDIRSGASERRGRRSRRGLRRRCRARRLNYGATPRALIGLHR